jgi:GNAT superfamily N-acetyltransferase
MEDFARITAADVDRTRAAAALDCVFAEYLVPISFAEPVYAIHVTANDVDAGSSPIWYDRAGGVVAAALLGVRGARGWIGGFGIVPARRGQGLGTALLAEIIERARALAIASIALEVLVENAPARRTYEGGGFACSRRLVTFTGEATRLLSRRAEAPYADPASFIDLPDETAPCWQREAASLRRQTNLHAVGDARAHCVFRHNGERAQLLKIRASSDEGFASLCTSVVGQTGVTRLELFNEPEASATAAAARALGWSVIHEMDEMVTAVGSEP